MSQEQWIRNPQYDLVFFCAFWWLPLSLLIFGMTATVATAVFYLLYHIFIRVPHFAATLNFTYLYKGNRQYYRANWVKYFAVPAMILLAYGSLHWFRSYTLYTTVLLTIAGVWGMQHIALQNYGILSLYRARSKARADALLPKLERAVFYELLLLAVFGGLLRTLFPAAELGNLVRDGSWAIGTVLVITCAVYFARIWNRRKVTPVSIPGLLYFATAVSVMVYWPVYNRLGVDGGLAFFYVFNGQHCLAYLGLLFHMTSNKQRSQRAFSSLAEGSAGFARFYAPLAIAAAGLLAMAVYRYSRNTGLFPLDIASASTALGMFNGIFVVHYYIESLTWRFSNAHNRAVVLPLLKHSTPALPDSAPPQLA